jgi:hypothetical protein
MFPTLRDVLNTVTCKGDSRQGFGLETGSIDHLRIATTTNYNSPTEPHTTNIIVNTAHINVFCLH